VDPRIARRAIAGALIAGVLADIAFDRVALGINVPLATMAILALVTWFSPRRRPADPIDWWLAGTAVVASLGPALRTDPTVVVLDLTLVLGSLGGWSLAVAGIPVTRRIAVEVLELGLEALLAVGTGAALILARSGADDFLARRAALFCRAAPLVRGLLVALPVVGVFTVLLTSADAVFGRGLEEILNHPVDLGEALRRAVFVLGAAWLVGGPIALAGGALRPPLARATDAGIPGPSEAGDAPAAAAARRGATEAMTVLVAVDALFAIFAAVQVMYLFGGADTLAAIGMTYSDYARQGYFQLVAVVALAGLLLVAVHLVVGRTRGFLISVAALLALTAVILASAALRLRLYQEAYGWTELRFYVAASIVWLAAGAVIAAALLWRDRMRWLAHGLAVSAVAITLGISALGPHAFVTHENLARVLNPALVAPGGHPGFDAAYAVTLGDDAVPELVATLDRLAPMDRIVVMRDMERRRDELGRDVGSAGWPAWNLARERAREALGGLPGR
jgi:hypothetical protein